MALRQLLGVPADNVELEEARKKYRAELHSSRPTNRPRASPMSQVSRFIKLQCLIGYPARDGSTRRWWGSLC